MKRNVCTCLPMRAAGPPSAVASSDIPELHSRCNDHHLLYINRTIDGKICTLSTYNAVYRIKSW